MAESDKGTFIVHIESNEHATWQGQVTWADKKLQQNFRSTFELLKLIDNAIAGENDFE